MGHNTVDIQSKHTRSGNHLGKFDFGKSLLDNPNISCIYHSIESTTCIRDYMENKLELILHLKTPDHYNLDNLIERRIDIKSTE